MGSPILFSQHFKISAEALDLAGLLDPFVNVDLPLFIDPLLIEKSSNHLISTDGLDAFRTYFEQLVRLLIMSESENDPAWKAAERHLSLKEPPENGLGYGRNGRSGNSRPARIRKQVLRTVKQVIDLGSKDPEMISLMGFLEEDVGPDTISDLTTRAMIDQFCKITHDFCVQQKIRVHDNEISGTRLPIFHIDDVRKPIILVPSDLVRHLPMTDSWAEVWTATQHNQALRDRVNKLLGGIMQPTIKEQKYAVREAVLQSSEIFDKFLSAVKSASAPYDKNEDIFGYFAFRNVILNNKIVKYHGKYDVSRGAEEVQKVVIDALNIFKHHVEHGNLWESLWAGDVPKRERASQLIFYAIADAYARVSNIDLSAEPNMGGGPVDFKFSTGYTARVLVEMKRSGGSVEHGYTKQLEFYKNAALTEFAIFVVIDYGDGEDKISKIKDLRDRVASTGARASEIFTVDAKKKASASKRH